MKLLIVLILSVCYLNASVASDLSKDFDDDIKKHFQF